MFHHDIIDGGMLVRTRWGRLPVRVGSIVRLRFELDAGEEVLAGDAQIAAIRDEENSDVTALALRFRGLTRAGQRLYAALLERSRGRDALRPRFSGADFRIEARPRVRAQPKVRARVQSEVRDDDSTVRIDVDPAFLAQL